MIQLEERLYTSTEVAEILGVSLRSVYRYLEEGKLDAEIKTATGRHRFSKKNIMDFLYPDGATTTKVVSEPTPVKETVKRNIEVERTPIRQPMQETPTPVMSSPVKEEPRFTKPEPVTTQETTEESEEPVDWLAKFREAAKKFREETEETEKVVPEPVKASPTSEPIRSTGFSNFTPEPVKETVSTKVLYYRSALGGLKDIAQNIDKTSRSAGIPYAFTMNAGLSLYKPIKPFSVLHAYIKPQDLPFFERVLSLTPSEEIGSQLCLYVSSDTSVFASREEMHGLFVVSKKKLLEDISKTSDNTLIEEAKSVL